MENSEFDLKCYKQIKTWNLQNTVLIGKSRTTVIVLTHTENNNKNENHTITDLRPHKYSTVCHSSILDDLIYVISCALHHSKHMLYYKLWGIKPSCVQSMTITYICDIECMQQFARTWTWTFMLVTVNNSNYNLCYIHNIGYDYYSFINNYSQTNMIFSSVKLHWDC